MLLHIGQLFSLAVQIQYTLVVLSQAACNYGLKLEHLTGELIPQLRTSADIHRVNAEESRAGNVESVWASAGRGNAEKVSQNMFFSSS